MIFTSLKGNFRITILSLSFAVISFNSLSSLISMVATLSPAILKSFILDKSAWFVMPFAKLIAVDNGSSDLSSYVLGLLTPPDIQLSFQYC